MLKITNLTKTFNIGTVNEKIALNKINLEIDDGDFITVIGGNGAGKSTLLNMISGMFDCSQGKIVLDKTDITHLPEYKRALYFGRVFQDPMMGTCSNMSIEENMAIAYKRGDRRGLGWGLPKSNRKLFESQLKRIGLGLENRLDIKVGTLSGGQRQAITLLMAAMRKPKLLLLDEHTAALDPKTAKQVLNLTEEITSTDNITTLMITHNMSDAIKYGNRLLMMNEGEIIFDVAGDDKKKLKVSDLLEMFEKTVGSKLENDRILLSE